MGTKLTWLRISLFSDIADRHHLLDQIRSYVASTPQNDSISSYHVEFNYLSGSNIRLLILCEDLVKEAVTLEIHNHFTNYFFNARTQVSELTLPVNGLFLPFPVNTIRYGLYGTPLKDTERNKWHTAITICIIEALAGECFNNDDILTFAFHLCLVWLNNISQLCQKIKFQEVISYFGQKELNPSLCHSLETEYKKNETGSIEIFNDIFSKPNSTLTPQWLNSFSDSCQTILRVEFDNGLSLVNVHNNFYVSISKSLGFTSGMNKILSYFISRTIQTAHYCC